MQIPRFLFCRRNGGPWQPQGTFFTEHDRDCLIQGTRVMKGNGNPNGLEFGFVEIDPADIQVINPSLISKTPAKSGGTKGIFK